VAQNLTIYSVYHKKFYEPIADFVVPVLCGKANNTANSLLTGDDTGQHISALSPTFRELTVLYWVWKNGGHTPDELWGLCHYRRYFSLPKARFVVGPKMHLSVVANPANIDRVLSPTLWAEMKRLLTNADVVVESPTPVSRQNPKARSVEKFLVDAQGTDRWQRTKALVLNKHPEYANAMAQLCQSKTLFFGHLMVARSSFWDAYLGWLFPILLALHDCEGSSGQATPPGVFAQLGEALMNLYLLRHRPKIVHLPVTSFERQ
jgi:hypothetical protein